MGKAAVAQAGPAPCSQGVGLPGEPFAVARRGPRSNRARRPRPAPCFLPPGSAGGDSLFPSYRDRFPGHGQTLAVPFDVQRHREQSTPVAASPGPSDVVHTRLPQLPGYEVLGGLGRGGLGVACKARQLSRTRAVAPTCRPAASHAGPHGRGGPGGTRPRTLVASVNGWPGPATATMGPGPHPLGRRPAATGGHEPVAPAPVGGRRKPPRDVLGCYRKPEKNFRRGSKVPPCG
jgi:hypothetical protein